MSINYTELAHTLTQVDPDSRCSKALDRLRQRLKAVSGSGKARKMAAVMAFIGNEVGSMKTYICETMQLDQFLCRNNRVFDASLFRFLDDIDVHKLPRVVKNLLKGAGFRENDKIQGARLLYSETSGGSKSGYGVVNVVKWKNTVIVSSKTDTAYYTITGKNTITLENAVLSLMTTTDSVSMENVSKCPEIYSALDRMLGYFTMLKIDPGLCEPGKAPDPDRVIDNGGYMVGRRSSSGGPRHRRWNRAHLRRKHVRHLADGTVRVINSMMIHGKPVLLRDRYRQFLDSVAVNA